MKKFSENSPSQEGRKFLPRIIEERFSNWLGRIEPKRIFLSMASLKALDTLSAWIVFRIRPIFFARAEANELIVDAFVNGKVYPFLFLQVSLYVLFGVIAFGLGKLSGRRNDSIFRTVALLPAILGVFTLWLYPIAISTNIVNGLLFLGLIWPLSKLIYAVFGYLFTFIALKYCWNLKDDLSLWTSFLIMVGLSLFL